MTHILTGKEFPLQFKNLALKDFIEDGANKMYFRRRKSYGSYFIVHYISEDSDRHSFVYNNIEERDKDFKLIYEK